MNLSFREKSLWVDLIATIGIAAYYAINLLEFDAQKLRDIHQVMGLLWDVLVLCIMVSIVSWVVLSIYDRKSAEAPLDERERFAELKASSYGFAALKIAISAVVIIYGLELVGLETKNGSPISLLPFLALHIIVASYVVAELVVTSTQLFFLRRGIEA